MNQAQRFFGIVATCGVLAVGAQTVAAQTEPGPPAGRGPSVMKRGAMPSYGPEYRLDLMTRRLALTEEQQAKIKQILEEEDAQLQALRGNDSYNRDERRSRLQELNTSTYEKIRPVLTPEQQAKHEKAKEIISEKRSKNRGSRPGPDQDSNEPAYRISRLSADLELSAEQQAKIKPILAEEERQLERLRGNDTYNREQRRSRLQELNQISYDRIKPILTPEQLKKFDKISVIITERRNQSKNPTMLKP